MMRIGVIGAGKWGVNHLRTLSEIRCELIGVSDTNPQVKETADRFGLRYFQNYPDLLKEVDAVTIAVPTDIHYEIVRSCLEQGKHVLVEKPITLNAERAKELVELAKRNRLILSVGYLFRFNSAVQELKRITKKIGRIHYISSRYIHSTKPPRKDSGVIFNLSIHLIDVLNFILEERPERVYCKKQNLISAEFEDSANMILTYRDFQAHIEISCVHPLKKRDMWIIAEEEKVYVDFLEQTIIRYPIKVSYERVEARDKIEVQLEKNEPLKEELRYFCECIEKHNGKAYRDIVNIGEEEYFTTKICENALRSAETGKEIILKSS